jgi:carbamate kinase
MTSPLAVVAVGGNALIRDKQHIALADQYDAVCATATHVADDDVSFAAGNSMT